MCFYNTLFKIYVIIFTCFPRATTPRLPLHNVSFAIPRGEGLGFRRTPPDHHHADSLATSHRRADAWSSPLMICSKIRARPRPPSVICFEQLPLYRELTVDEFDYCAALEPPQIASQRAARQRQGALRPKDTGQRLIGNSAVFSSASALPRRSCFIICVGFRASSQPTELNNP